jgi:TIR domain
MSQVFLSYARADQGIAHRLFSALKGRGIEVFFDYEISEGVEERLRRQADVAGCVLVIWSKAAARSRSVNEEMHQAIKAWSTGRLVLATVDDTPLPIGLRDLTAIRIRQADDIEELVQRVHAIISTENKAVGTNGKAREKAEVRSYGSVSTSALKHETAWRKPTARRAWLWWSICFPVGAISLWLLTVSFNMSRPPVLPAPPLTVASGPSLVLILTLLVLGAAIGAMVVWVWTAWSHRQSKRTSPMPSAVGALSAVPAKVPPEVFVSYSRQDTRTVDQLVNQIEVSGYGVWIDRESSGTQRYAAEIVGAIRMSKLVALMCSQNAFSSDHVIREIYVAGDYKKPFIAFLLDMTEFPDEVHYFLSGFPRVPIVSIDQKKLQSTIAGLVGAVKS